VANVRMHFNKCNGNMGSSGSVAFMFTRMGVFRLDPEGIDADEIAMELIDDGLEDIGEGTDDKGNPRLVLRCAFNDFGSLQAGLERLGLEPTSSGAEYVPDNVVSLSEEAAEEVLKLIDRLEQDDDVQQVFHNLG
jgi:transcriptional/translational regulatory protein YebC/TACO1